MFDIPHLARSSGSFFNILISQNICMNFNDIGQWTVFHVYINMYWQMCRILQEYSTSARCNITCMWCVYTYLCIDWYDSISCWFRMYILHHPWSLSHWTHPSSQHQNVTSVCFRNPLGESNETDFLKQTNHLICQETAPSQNNKF